MKVTRLAVLSLLLPLGLAAQAPAPSGAGPMTDVFRNRTVVFQRNLAQAFDSIPEAKFGYRPTPAQMTIGNVAQHLANDNYFYCNQFGDAKGTRAPEETSTPDSVKAGWPKATLVAQLKSSFAFCEEAFKQLTDAKLAEQMTLTAPNGQTRTLTRMQPVLGHIVDMADHYSQIANYMRLNGMLPPTALPRPPRP